MPAGLARDQVLPGGTDSRFPWPSVLTTGIRMKNNFGVSQYAKTAYPAAGEWADEGNQVVVIAERFMLQRHAAI